VALCRLAAALSCVRSVNKTDAAALGANLGSLADILRAGQEQLAAVPGVGPTKVPLLAAHVLLQAGWTAAALLPSCCCCCCLLLPAGSSKKAAGSNVS
jgi:hypothetical protein